jgi:hypothetical protein
VAFALKITSSVRSHNSDKNFDEGYKCGRLPEASQAQVRCRDRDIYGRQVLAGKIKHWD